MYTKNVAVYMMSAKLLNILEPAIKKICVMYHIFSQAEQ